MEKEIRKNIEKNIQKHDTLPIEDSFDFQTQDGGIYKCSYTVKKLEKVFFVKR